MKRLIHLSSILFCLLCISCVKEDDIRHDSNDFSLRASVTDVSAPTLISIAQMKEWLEDYDSPENLGYDSRMKYDVDFYHITYYTQYGLEGSKLGDPQLVEARAVLLVPHGIRQEDGIRYAVYYHGTTLPVKEITDALDKGTPNDFVGNNPCSALSAAGFPMASSGYCVILPEYTGYGPTAKLDHPFIYYPELWMSAVDGLIAGRTVLSDPKYGLGLKPGKDLYISGWSQGAGLGLYTQKMLENDSAYKDRFNVKLSSLLAGPYDMERFLGDMLDHQEDIYLLMPLYSWAGYAVNRFCPSLQRPMDQIFRLPLNDQISAITLFGNTPWDLFQQFFIQHMQDKTDYAFIQALKEDSTSSGWDPVAPVILHHGTEDFIVPFFNSESAYAGLKDRAKGGLTFYPHEGENHSSYLAKYVKETLDAFDEL